MLSLLFPSIFLLGCDDGNKLMEIQNSLPTIENSISWGRNKMRGYEVQILRTSPISTMKMKNCKLLGMPMTN